MNLILKSVSLIFLTCIIISSASAQSPERKDVPNNHKWNLADIYSSTEAWQKDVDKLKTEVDKLAEFKGTLSSSSATLYTALKTGNDLVKTLSKAWTYASNLSNENLNIAENQALMQQMSALGTKFGEVTAYVEPEILQIPKDKIDLFFKEKPELAKEFDMYIDNIQRLRNHTLTEAEEKILASFGLISDVQGDVYDIFTNAEKPFPKVTIS
ncbi:MAG TPA: oligoendopeptidase F, partial [Ignavibacteriaceae bacterium]